MRPSPDGPFTSALERAYWGAPEVTPQRQDAWERWKDDYLASCVEGWVSQGAERDDLIKAAAVVLHDLGAVDDLPWMPVGPALSERLGTLQLNPNSDKELDSAAAKVVFINALRTTQTSNRHDRISATAYQLGTSIAQVARIVDTMEDASHVPDTQAGTRTALYRHFDLDGVLLYIGITKSPEDRAKQHDKQSSWARFSATSTIEWHASREDAHDAERAAIKFESPVFNTCHNGSNRRAAIDYLFSALETSTATPSGATRGGAA